MDDDTAAPSFWDRQRFKDELDADPALHMKVLRVMANEQGRHPQGTQGVAESMMNQKQPRPPQPATAHRRHRRP
jgi:hypothetical protein